MPLPATANATAAIACARVRNVVRWSGSTSTRHSPYFGNASSSVADDVLVDSLQGFHFLVAFALVRGFIRRFNVHANQVVIGERGRRR